jgi:anaerobic magnesium-protoporphyrin IX monomethyl ester cyclase
MADSVDALLFRLYRPHVFIPNRGADEQLGLLYVATAAKHAGFAVEVLDSPEITISALENVIAEKRPRVVGFYTDHDNVFTVMSAIDAIKNARPEVKCVTGGPQAREWDRRLLEESACDVVVRCEGEFVFAELLRYFLQEQGDIATIAGISYRNAGQVQRNRDAEAIDLDRIPIPDRTLNVTHPSPSGVENIITGRGCPFRCAFCYEGRPEARYRARSLDNVVAELEHLVVDRGAKYIAILDDVFTLNPKRVMQVVDAFRTLRERTGRSFSWFCEARADIICKRPEMVKACVDAGLVRIQIGVETGNQAVLDAYNKKLALEETEGAVRICNDADVLSIIGNFIIGGARETPDTLQDSITFAKKLLEAAPGRMEVSTTIFTPYPGTPMYQFPERFGLSILDPDCLTGPGDHYPFACTDQLSKWEILDGREKFVEAINDKMAELIPQIPGDVVERHFSAFVRYNMRTRWFDTFCKSYNYYNYFGLPAWSPDIQPLVRVPDNQLGDWKPLRTCYLATTHNGKFIVNAGHRRIELSDRAGAVLELCGGRLPLARFSEQLTGRGVELDDAEIMGLLAQLDADRLIVFARA